MSDEHVVVVVLHEDFLRNLRARSGTVIGNSGGLLEQLIEIGRSFVLAMHERRGLGSVDEMYAENAQSIEAVVPPVRQFRVTKGREAIKGKREDWLASYEIQELDVDGPYVHPPNRFGVRFRAEVIQKATGERMTLREIAVYSVAEGKIVLEEFFMLPK